MDPKHDDTPDTRTRLLAAALEVFADRGYHETSFRAVCQLAQANVAAINYHFRDKQQLYLEVLENAMRGFPVPFPPDGPQGVQEAEEQLRRFIALVIPGILRGGPESRMARIMSHEMMHPSPVLDQVIQRIIQPVHRGLQRIVGVLLGMDPESCLARDCANSVIGQCLHYDHGRRVIQQLGDYREYDDATLGHLVDHVSEFSLAAIRALRDGQAAGGSGTHE